MKRKPLDIEEGRRLQAEVEFETRRTKLVCESCHAVGRLSLSSSGNKRRFQCSCNKSWSVTRFLESIVPHSSTHPVEDPHESNHPLDEITPTLNHDDVYTSTDESSDGSPSPVHTKCRAIEQNAPQRIPHANSSYSQLFQEHVQLKEHVLQMNKRMSSLERILESLPPTSLNTQLPKNHHFPILTEDEFPLLPYPSVPSLSASPSPLPISSASSFKGRSTFADILKRVKITDTERPAALNALAVLQRRKPSPLTNSPIDLKHKIRRIYVGNLPRLPLSELKKYLFTLHFSLSKILNMSYVGRSIIEFTIMEDYERSMLAHLNRYEFPILQNYHPGKAQDPKASSEVANSVFSSFKARIQRLAEQSRKNSVKEYFSDWLESIATASSDTSILPKNHPMTVPKKTIETSPLNLSTCLPPALSVSSLDHHTNLPIDHADYLYDQQATSNETTLLDPTQLHSCQNIHVVPTSTVPQ